MKDSMPLATSMTLAGGGAGQVTVTVECSACEHTVTEHFVRPVDELNDAWAHAAATIEQAIHLGRDGCDGPMTATVQPIERQDPKPTVRPGARPTIGGAL